MSVYELFVELDAFALERLQDEVVHRPEGFFGKGGGAQSVLVAHHHQPVVEVLANEAQVSEQSFGEAQFAERVYLFVGRFFNECSVAVDEKNFLFHNGV